MDAFLGVDKSARAGPESPAILAPGQCLLSYSALSQSIADLRLQFAAAGIVKDQRIALVFPNGPDFLVALLAASAFGPCAPLDPSASQQEYKSYFAQLRAPVLVASMDLDSGAFSSAKAQGMRVLRLSHQLQIDVQGCTESSKFGLPAVTPARLLLFTSSTTGHPKLVPVTSANLEVSCRNEARVLELTAQDRLLNLTPQFNSRGVRAALTQLCQGGSIVCAPRFDPESFPQWLDEFKPTWISVAATGLAALYSLSRRIPGLWRAGGVRFIRTGGTAPEARSLRDLEQLSGVPVLDGYGTTETGGVTRQTIGRRKSGSVGRTTGAEIRILDEAGNIVGPLTPGEIAIRGPSVMSGYLENDAANQRALRGDWFRTANLGYLDEEGFLFLTGRIDEVINRGGQKVLPQEVEAALKDHPAVEDAAVFGAAHKTLGEEVAALVVLNSRPVPEAELRRFVAERLTSYKVPSSILFVDQLPRTPAGKLRRKLLRETHRTLADLEHQASEVPATETEKAVAAIWEKELRQSAISRDADFFRIGGDSLTAALVGAQLQATFGLRLDVRVIAEHPKLRDLSRVLDDLRQRDKTGLEPLEYASRNGPLPLSYAQERIWKFAMRGRSSSSAAYNMAFVHRLQGPLDREILRRSMNHLVARHEILRTTFEMSDGTPVQVVHSTASCEFSVADVSRLSEPERHARSMLEHEAAKPFDLARGPLVRFVLVYLGNHLGRDEHWLIRVNHHIISDAHSWRLYFAELGSVYADFVSGGTALPAPSPRIDYGDYALWQRRELSQARPIFWKSVKWWAEQFSRLPGRSASRFHKSVNRLTARKRWRLGSVPASEGVLVWGIDPETSSRLDRLCNTEGVSCTAARLAAFTALLAEVIGQPEVILGTHFGFRNRLEWQDVMGDFTNLVTLPFSVNTARSFRESVRMVHENTREAHSYGEIPYELLCEGLRSRRVTPPRIEVMFHWAEQSMPMRLGEVEMTWLARVAPVMPWGFSMFMDKHNEGHLCLVLFNAGLYKPAAMRVFVGQFQRLLNIAARFPDHTLGQLLAAIR